jgi:hypothetical protein
VAARPFFAATADRTARLEALGLRARSLSLWERRPPRKIAVAMSDTVGTVADEQGIEVR